MKINRNTKCRNCQCYHFNITDALLEGKVEFQETCSWCALDININKGCTNYEPKGNLEYLEQKYDKKRLSL